MEKIYLVTVASGDEFFVNYDPGVSTVTFEEYLEDYKKWFSGTHRSNAKKARINAASIIFYREVEG